MDNITKSILNKKINGIMSGVKSTEVKDTSLVFTFTDGTTSTMSFPNAVGSDGVSVTDIQVNSNKHLLFTFSNGIVKDVGELPQQIASIDTTQIDEYIADKNLLTKTDVLSCISDRPIYFNSVAEMKSSAIPQVGNTVATLGYYSANDGGSATYVVRDKSDSDIDNGGNIIITNSNLVCELVVTNGEVNVKQFGVKGDGVTDDTIPLTNALSNNIVNGGKFECYITSPIAISTENICIKDLNIIVDAVEVTTEIAENGWHVLTFSKMAYIYDLTIKAKSQCYVPYINLKAEQNSGMASNVVGIYTSASIYIDGYNGYNITGVYASSANENTVEVRNVNFQNAENFVFINLPTGKFICDSGYVNMSTKMNSIYYHVWYIYKVKTAKISNIIYDDGDGTGTLGNNIHTYNPSETDFNDAEVEIINCHGKCVSTFVQNGIGNLVIKNCTFEQIPSSSSQTNNAVMVQNNASISFFDCNFNWNGGYIIRSDANTPKFYNCTFIATNILYATKLSAEFYSCVFITSSYFYTSAMTDMTDGTECTFYNCIIRAGRLRDLFPQNCTTKFISCSMYNNNPTNYNIADCTNIVNGTIINSILYGFFGTSEQIITNQDTTKCLIDLDTVNTKTNQVVHISISAS